MHEQTAQARDATARVRLALPEIVRMRWIAVAVGSAVLLAASRLLGGVLSYPILWGVLAFTAVSNLWLARRAGGPHPQRLAGLALAADIVSLTVLLAESGGPHNPFALLYAIPVAMAAMVGSAYWVWLLAAIAAAGYAASFLSHRSVHFWHDSIALPGIGAAVELHLLGMWISIVVVSVFTIAFIQRLLKVMTDYERALREAEHRLSHTERLAALTALAAGAAHELASPLGTVAIVARELERKANRHGSEEYGADATLIRDEVDRCREILDRMARAVRDGSAPETGTRSVADLWDLLSAELGEEIERVRFDNELSDPTESLPIPAIQLAPLLIPLIRNAFDATGAAGSARPVEVHVRRELDAVRVDVCDHGTGMRADVLARAAEPLFTTKAERGGSGLGLFLVQVVCEALGGQLVLDSSAGGGTRASLRFRASQVRS